jgi:hypothetical protein
VDISTKKFVNYIETSFTTNRNIYDILVLILFNQYDLNKVISNIIDRDNIDLLEDILSNNYDVKLDENLILKTLSKGRVTMAKAIYEYIYDVKPNSYSIIRKLIDKYDFVYNENENSIDSFVLAIHLNKYKHAKNIIPYINPNFWNNFAIKYACRHDAISLMKCLLSHNMVDPTIDKEYVLRISIENGYYDIANELLKHPSSRIDKVDGYFISDLIENNYLCVAKKILGSENNDIISLFKSVLESMQQYINDVTKLVNQKKYPLYIQIPYDQQLDPIQIYKRAISDNDMELAKSINYVLSIKPEHLFKYLKCCRFGSKKKSVSSYIWNNILKEYDPNELLLEAHYDEIIINNIFDMINHFSLKINYGSIWIYYYDTRFDIYLREMLWDHMKDNCTFTECEKFVIDKTGQKLDSKYNKLSKDDKMAKLDIIVADLLECIYY